MTLSRRITLGGLMALQLATVTPAQAEIDLGSVDMLASDSPTSPVPQGLVVGATLIGGRPATKRRTTPSTPSPALSTSATT